MLRAIVLYCALSHRAAIPCSAHAGKHSGSWAEARNALEQLSKEMMKHQQMVQEVADPFHVPRAVVTEIPERGAKVQHLASQCGWLIEGYATCLDQLAKHNPACALQGIAARWLSAHYKTIARSIARAMAWGLGFVTPCPNKQGKNAYFSKVSDASGTACDAVNVREDCKHFGPPLWVVPVEERGPFGGPS